MTTNNKQQYELTILLDENATEDDIQHMTETIKRYGEVTKMDDEGVKRLAYNIKGHERAHYLFYYLELDTYRYITEELSTNSDVLRYLLVRTRNFDGGNR